MQKSHGSVKSPITVFLSLGLVLLSLELVLLSHNKYPTRDFGHLTGVFASQWYFSHRNPCGVFSTYISHHVYCTTAIFFNNFIIVYGFQENDNNIYTPEKVTVFFCETDFM